jgi:hypothetical protein
LFFILFLNKVIILECILFLQPPPQKKKKLFFVCLILFNHFYNIFVFNIIWLTKFFLRNNDIKYNQIRESCYEIIYLDVYLSLNFLIQFLVSVNNSSFIYLRIWFPLYLIECVHQLFDVQWNSFLHDKKDIKNIYIVICSI